ncbi:hypothetical protein CO678_26075 [Bradyrhizobium diazoefficiens]|nr:hypothetical protein CO678_26075 [Bradyrhizobium diazoefficiens]
MTVVGVVVGIALEAFQVEIVAIELHAICIARRRRRILRTPMVAPPLLHPARLIESVERALQRGAAAAQLGRHADLAARTPASAIDMTAEQTQRLQVARFERAISHRARGNDRQTGIRHVMP